MATKEHLTLLVTLMVVSPWIVSVIGQTAGEYDDDPFAGLCGKPSLPCSPGEKKGHQYDCKVFYECSGSGDNFTLKSCAESKTFDTRRSKCRRTKVICATCPTVETETNTNILGDSIARKSSAFKGDLPTGVAGTEKNLLTESTDLEPTGTEKNLLTDSTDKEPSVSKRALATEADGSLINGTEQSPTESDGLPRINSGKVNTDETNDTMAEVPGNATETGVPATDRDNNEETTGTIMEELTTSEKTATTIVIIKTTPTTTTTTMKPTTTIKTTTEATTSSTVKSTEVQVPSATNEVKPPYVVLTQEPPEATTAGNGTGLVGGTVHTGGLSPIMIAVIGGILAGVILLIVVLIIVVCVIRKRKRKKGMAIPTIYNPQYQSKQTYRFSGDTNLNVNGRVHLHPQNSHDDDGEGAIVILSPKKKQAPPRPSLGPKGSPAVDKTKRKAPPPPNPFTGEVEHTPLFRRESDDYYERERDKDNNVELSSFGVTPPKKPPRTFSDGGTPIDEEEDEEVFNTTDPLLTSVSNDNAYIPNGDTPAHQAGPDPDMDRDLEEEDDSDEDITAEQEYGTQHGGFKPKHDTGSNHPVAESYDDAKNPFFADDGESY